MKTTALSNRFASLLAIVGGLAYAVEGAIVARAPQGDDHWNVSGYTVEAAFVVALVATIPLLPRLAASLSKTGRLAARVSQVGFGAMLVSAVASLAVGGTTLGPAFLLGVLAAVAGLTTLTAVAVRTRTTHWWLAPLTLIGLVLSMALGDHGGGILFGLAWIGISLAFHDQPQRRAAVPARA
jgi:hypothetical protein